VARKVPPPDFRYVSLVPGPSSAAVSLATSTVGLGTIAVALHRIGHHPIALGLTLGLAGALSAALMFARGQRGPLGARQVAMVIVPWGLIVEPETAPRILRWPAIRKISVHVSHVMDGGTPSVVSSTVVITTDRDVLSGRTQGNPGLEGLTANLDAYAAEATRLVAADLDGDEIAGDGAIEPVIPDLLHRAEALCSTAQGAAALALPPGHYRSVAARVASPETVSILRAALSPRDSLADPRPLAALVAGLLGARELLPELLGLAVSPHPIAAAAARAAALRLGAAQSRAGALDEVAAFLFEEDHAELERWVASAA
jgi:hypothetical protein